MLVDIWWKSLWRFFPSSFNGMVQMMQDLICGYIPFECDGPVAEVER